jgi:perosamine synthetase
VTPRVEAKGRSVSLLKPAIREEAIEAVSEVLRSGWLGLGPRTEAFEKAFAAYVGAPHCVALNSCTSALHLGLVLLGLPPGSEVITTPITFVSTNHAILYVGCRPVFADVEPATGNLSVRSVRSRITDRTRALVAVHYAGYPADLDELYALARERGLEMIEDCAHACGATYKGRRIGSHGQLHAFSFHAVKNLAMGDGGALTLRSERFDGRLRRLRWLGIDKDTFTRAGRTYAWDYRVEEVGFKYHMDDIHAAIGLAQLAYLEQDNQRRRQVAAAYRLALAGVPGVSLLESRDDRTSSNHLFPILAEERDRLIEKLNAHGVEAGVHYRRNDRYRMFEEADLPNAERFWRREISLPMHPLLTDDDVGHVSAVIRSGW